MNGLVKFLEKYVQWVALGIALLWVGYVGYAYWYQPPVAVEIGSVPETPDKIDADLQKSGSPFDRLTTVLEGRGPKAALLAPTTKPVPVADEFVRRLAMGPASVAGLNSGGPVAVKAPAVADNGKNDPNMPKATLPDLAGAIVPNGSPTADNGVYLTPPVPVVPIVLVAAPNPGDPAAAAAPAPVQPPPPAPALGPDGQPLPPVTAEKAWVKVPALLDPSAIAASFKAANVPRDLNTTILRVQLVRRELRVDGSYGPEEVIPDLGNKPLAEWPVKPQPGQAPEQAALDYWAWAQANMPDVIQPAFYPLAPDQQPEAAIAEAAFDPAHPGPPSELTPEQRKMVVEYNKQKAQEATDERKRKAAEAKAKHDAASGSRGTGGGASTIGGSGARSFGYLPLPPDANTRDRSARVQNFLPPPPSGDSPSGNAPAGRRPVTTTPPLGRTAPGAATPPGGKQTTRPAGGIGGLGGGADPANAPNTNLALPPGDFNPIQWPKPIEIWAYDETALPGHTYQYKVRVFLKNPLFLTDNVAAKVEDSNQFDIHADSDWTAPVAVPRREYFFVAQEPATGTNSVKIAYYWWEMGKWSGKELKVSPGDLIGKTQWSIVDIRNDNRVIMVSEAGDVQFRYARADSKDPNYLQLKQITGNKGGTSPVSTGN